MDSVASRKWRTSEWPAACGGEGHPRQGAGRRREAGGERRREEGRREAEEGGASSACIAAHASLHCCTRSGYSEPESCGLTFESATCAGTGSADEAPLTPRRRSSRAGDTTRAILGSESGTDSVAYGGRQSMRSAWPTVPGRA